MINVVPVGYHPWVIVDGAYWSDGEGITLPSLSYIIIVLIF